MEIFIKIVQLLLSLSILVIFHELGHFTAARIFRTRVEKFYLFFNPWFSLFKFKKGETEYGLGWLPLGGYVKISGMIDESMDREQMKQPPQPWEFRSKPAWQRLIIMLGGVTVNLLLAIAIYIVMLYFMGEKYLPVSEAKYGITVDSLGYRMGLRNGDQIVSVDKKTIDDFASIPKSIILEEAKTIQVIRDGEAVDVVVPEKMISQLIRSKSVGFISFAFPYVIDRFAPGSPAEKAGIMVNDRIIGFNDTILPYFDRLKALIPTYKNQEITLRVVRGQDTLGIPVRVSEKGRIEVYAKPPTVFLTFHEKDYSLLAAVPAGFVKAFEGAGGYLKSLKLLFSQEKAYESVGGFISIGNIFPGTWDWVSFWSMTAFLSIMLAILNVLPIPALDGGHVLFLLYEMVFRRKPGDKFMEYAQITGMVILLALLVFANLNDVINLFR